LGTSIGYGTAGFAFNICCLPAFQEGRETVWFYYGKLVLLYDEHSTWRLGCYSYWVVSVVAAASVFSILRHKLAVCVQAVSLALLYLWYAKHLSFFVRSTLYFILYRLTLQVFYKLSLNHVGCVVYHAPPLKLSLLSICFRKINFFDSVSYGIQQSFVAPLYRSA
jgi:hypothetical protein